MPYAKALHGNPFDGHTFVPAIADVEKNTAIEVKRIHVDKDYRCRCHSHLHEFHVWISRQVCRNTAAIRRELTRKDTVEPVIRHLKAEHRRSRNYLNGRRGDCINSVLADIGDYFSLILRWIAEHFRTFL